MQARTPNANSIEFNCGGFETLSEALDYAATGVTGLNFYSVRGELEYVLTYAELQARATEMAARLSTETEPGDLIGLIAETSPDFAIMFFACQYAGVLPVPVSVPVTLGSNEFYKDQLKRICETANLHCLLAPKSILSVAQDALEHTQIQVGNLDGSDLSRETSPLRPFAADGMCYIQFSSGSTSSPKGIVGSQKSVTTNCRAIQLGLEARAGDRISSWLPLYHDMGLIGQFLAPMMAQLSVDYIDSKSFARRPSTWLKLISENKATHSYSPSFGYEISAKRWRGGELDLSSWRVAGIGGDMVREEALKKFADVFREHGFCEKAFVPSYGLAEATVAVSFSPLRTGFQVDVINSDIMRSQQKAVPADTSTEDRNRRALIACGQAIPGHEMKICDDDGNEVEERVVGRIMFRGDSVSPGILDRDAGILPLTDKDGWLDTGDLGYWLNGQLVITGRHKDLILWNGRNIWPQDIEWTAEHAGGRHIPKSAAFKLSDDDGNGHIYLLAECKARRPEQREELMSEITANVRQTVGAPIEVIFVPTRSLIMTSSGKLSRMRTRQKFISGAFELEHANSELV
ncbi:MAG: fatty acyl-AMP ligase [Henriciella sp.]|nr:fatty acyl-AMP ligase [Henriciella sp.]